jgi:SAM-dependent methyltransferase
MTRYEAFYRIARAFDHPLNQRVFRLLASLERESGAPLRILDVGGRRSPYTVGLRGRVTITDVPRETDLQRSLNLGATPTLRSAVLSRRSNVADYVFDDMVSTALPGQAYDLVVSVEVLEHVEEDEAFVANVARVLGPGGIFVMTTPNGDLLPTPYPDHKRHYQRQQLEALLRRHFARVEIGYAVKPGWPMTLATRKPGVTRIPRLRPVGHLIAGRLERMGLVSPGSLGLRHLVAVARTPTAP